MWLFQCYASLIKNYSQISNLKHENSVEIGLSTENARDDTSEMRQRLAAAADSAF